jgi:hypothetical protein
MHSKSAMKSAPLRLFRANCRSDWRFDARPRRSPHAGDGPAINALVAEGEAFDDLDPPISRSLALNRASASQVEAIVATERGPMCERARYR